ncbi:MAG: thioredoxin family protein [Lentimicrobium sp.]|jgi:hypothetical protein|uniref:thioredoxin family protein n=2 Tax=Lentimicrobium sp. TaxID=2034841 RepID=UPI0025CE24F1|nr:thioredoxin family protein [Lentimicrobium sp.]MCO5256947.1 thioredoxin family protein [Lentimicrobium sp.]MCO5261911.1 thioredoxin family protein [Lentimicrobium sp.]HOP13139.1 thioredoxin family protein [Lentimicrobium sp.]HPF65411.1 thioredoxin family protein [Lentimicrobium sp.]HRW70040.1 thioredoxin family protein [Lentimicrobium sp.]
MRKSLTLISALLFMVFNLSAQENHRVNDEKSGKEILIGTVTRDGLAGMGEWFNSEYNLYQPDTMVVAHLKFHSGDYPWIFIALGTWCSDSREQVPRFLKILDQLAYPADRIFMVAVDRDKKAKDFCIGDYDIKLVPTFIFTRQGEEIGRIIETPVESLERDFMNILNGRASAPRN